MKLGRVISDYWIFVMVAGICIFTAILLWPSSEPCYQGKRLSAWAEQMSYSDSKAETWLDEGGVDPAILKRREEAVNAIRHIGTDALPYAIKWCVWREPIFSFDENEEDPRPLKGMAIFKALGPEAKSAVPQLIALSGKGGYGAIANSLEYIGPDAVPALVEALTNSNDLVRNCALNVLGNLASTNQTALDAIVASLDDKNPRIQSTAASALFRLGKIRPIRGPLPPYSTNEDLSLHVKRVLMSQTYIRRSNGTNEVVPFGVNSSFGGEGFKRKAPPAYPGRRRS